MDRPQGTQVDLWKIYYGRLSDRFRALYPHRLPEEISDKLHSMIAVSIVSVPYFIITLM